MKLGVASAWHGHPWEELLDLVRRAEALGHAAAFVDGDGSMLAERPVAGLSGLRADAAQRALEVLAPRK